jgi:hypothetical protein
MLFQVWTCSLSCVLNVIRIYSLGYVCIQVSKYVCVLCFNLNDDSNS